MMINNQQMGQKYDRALGHIERFVSIDLFEKYVVRSSDNKTELFTAIKSTQCDGLPRFNVWRMLLEVMPVSGSWDDKKAALESSRKKWATLKEQAQNGLVKPVVKEAPVVPKNPLMKAMAKKTEQKEEVPDAFLNSEIKKDVDRTYQELSFFQDESIARLLTNILFVWCKLNPDISYKQGTNEILASIVWVYFQEAAPSQTHPSNDIEEKFLFLNSIVHAQADIYFVFERVMDLQKHMYKQNLDDDVKGKVNPNSKNNSPILQRIIHIQDQKLKALDLELFRIMKLQDVKTKSFLLRWIRCMHTRQFGLVTSLVIWDSIFLEAYESPNSKTANQFEFVDAMCLAMFIYMRSIVLTRETANEILQIYQKYPQLSGEYLKELIGLAWSLIHELRIIKDNQNNSSNWFEDQGKTQKLGLMQRGGYNETMKEAKKKESFLIPSPPHQPQSDISPMPSPERPIERQALVETAPSPVVQPVKKEEASPQPVHTQNLNKTYAHPEPSSPVKKPSPPSKEAPQIAPKSVERVVQQLPQRQITFTTTQLSDILKTLRKSMALNDNIESRALTNKVLKGLEDRLNPKK